MSGKPQPDKRALFIKACMEHHLSAKSRLPLAEVIKKARLSGGDEAAEAKAEELTALIEKYKTDEAILEAIKGM